MTEMLKIENLSKFFPAARKGVFGDRRFVKAVDRVSFSIENSETLGLVGESGCGKSTLGRAILKLLEPTGGRIIFNEDDITKFSRKEMKPYRRNMQMIFQDPYASLNPRMTVDSIVGEPLKVHRLCKSKNEISERIRELLQVVGLPTSAAKRYPGEFSGGQRQRIMIARILSTNPALVICDEAVSALDVSIQSQILNLLADLREEFSMTYIFISHDLGVVKFISDRIAVMYLGRIVEMDETNDLYSNPLHPYTKSLLSSIPSIKSSSELKVLKGETPSPIETPTGCYFHPRCNFVMDVCRRDTPELRDVGDGHLVACHLMEV
ncbi:MAG TPA: ABC transporter ATP-binding protein [Mesotoga infera]|uniref:ABC transporter ATP-binding protein n=1 Tax=Mesotoga infera TaxID=1236046 RepID=A0A7C1CWD5_9BACT|nr:ABC transporter ATP-binding protein [Mesotoga infera]